MSAEEILDLVDENDDVIGQMSRKEIYEKGLHNYRVVHGFVVNGEGKIWIPKRTMTKKIYPGALDYSSAGHVEAGETYDESFARETSEELNIDVTATTWRQLGKLTPAEGAHCFQMVYEVRSDVSPSYNPDDFSEAFWLTPAEAVAKIEGGAYAKTDLASTIKKFYLS